MVTVRCHCDTRLRPSCHETTFRQSKIRLKPTDGHFKTSLFTMFEKNLFWELQRGARGSEGRSRSMTTGESCYFELSSHNTRQTRTHCWASSSMTVGIYIITKKKQTNKQKTNKTKTDKFGGNPETPTFTKLFPTAAVSKTREAIQFRCHYCWWRGTG